MYKMCIENYWKRKLLYYIIKKKEETIYTKVQTAKNPVIKNFTSNLMRNKNWKYKKKNNTAKGKIL